MSTELSNQNKQAPRTMTIRDRLRSPAMIDELSRVLPSHCKPERMARVAMTALTRTPKLAECDQASFFKCLLDLSAWGLEPDGRRAHLIPFNNRKRGVVECNLIIDFKGLVELAYRSGMVSSIHADVVCEEDDFEYDLGEIRHHRINLRKPRGSPYAAYARVVLKDGSVKCEVLSREEVESIRRRSKSANDGPWVTDWAEMAKKTAFRRLSKWIPLSAEFHEAVERDDDKLADVVEARPENVRTVSSLDSIADELTNRLGRTSSPPPDEEPVEQAEEGPPEAQDETPPVEEGSQSVEQGAPPDRLQEALDAIKRATTPDEVRAVYKAFADVSDKDRLGDAASDKLADLQSADKMTQPKKGASKGGKLPLQG